MSRDFNVYLEDILQAADRIEQYVAGRTKVEFLADLKTQDAVIRNLEVIGEAARHLPDELRKRATAIEWKGSRLARFVDSSIFWR